MVICNREFQLIEAWTRDIIKEGHPGENAERIQKTVITSAKSSGNRQKCLKQGLRDKQDLPIRVGEAVPEEDTIGAKF